MADNSKWYQLPPDINSWQTVIVSNLSRKIPDIPRYISGMDLPKLDPVVGDADGLVYLLNGLAAVPITIRNSKLAPLDIMVTKSDEFYPVTEAFLQKIYADNVIGQPQNPPTMTGDGEPEEGPAVRVRRIPTIDNQVKMSSVQVREALREKIASSTELLTFFNTHRPEVLQALSPAYDYKEEKVASAEPELPDVHFVSHDGSHYYFNGTEISASQAGDLMKAAGLSSEEKASVLQGGAACLDYRDSHSTLVLDSALEDCEKVAALSIDDGGFYLATCVDMNSVPQRGLLLRQSNYVDKQGELINYVFISPNFHAVQEDMLIMDKQPMPIEEVASYMHPTQPKSNMFGILIGNNRVVGPVRIASVERYGTISFVKVIFNGLEDQDGYAVGRDYLFYQIPEHRESLMKNPDDIYLSTPGATYTAKKTFDGSIVLDNKELEYSNALFSLMNDRGLTFDDALRIGERVKAAGYCKFKVAADDNAKSKPSSDGKGDSKGDSKDSSKGKPFGSNKSDKSGDSNKSDKKPSDGDKSKSKSKDTSSKTDGGDKPKQVQRDTKPGASKAEPSPDQIAQDPGLAFATGAPTGDVPANDDNSMVNFDDMQDIAKVNDPKLMDAYLSGSLAEANVAGREEMMQISDDVIESIKSLGKLLFRVRLGQVDYVSESDIQMALNKMSDIAKAIGVSSTQITDPTGTSGEVEFPAEASTKPTSDYRY